MEEFFTDCFSFTSLGKDPATKSKNHINDEGCATDYIEPFFLNPKQILPKKNEFKTVEEIPPADIMRSQRIVQENYQISIPELPQAPKDEEIEYWDD